jgi:hypothetical protein
MAKLPFLIWLLLFTVLAGALITVVLLIPSLQAMGLTAIVIAAAIAAVVSVPFSLSVAKAMR